MTQIPVVESPLGDMMIDEPRAPHLGDRVLVLIEQVTRIKSAHVKRKMWVPCVIVSQNNHFGNLRYEVEPVGGRGSHIVDAGRVGAPAPAKK